MIALLDKISFDGLRYNELTNESHKRMVEMIVEKLKPLEYEIINSENGQLFMKPSGTVFVDSFSKELSDKISSLIK